MLMIETGVTVIDVDSGENMSGGSRLALSLQACAPNFELLILLAVAQEHIKYAGRTEGRRQPPAAVYSLVVDVREEARTTDWLVGSKAEICRPLLITSCVA